MKTIEEIYRSNLMILISEFGTQASLAATIRKAPAQISQWINASLDSKIGKPRAMSRETAREIEAATGKPSGWMDTHHMDFEAEVMQIIQSAEFIQHIETSGMGVPLPAHFEEKRFQPDLKILTKDGAVVFVEISTKAPKAKADRLATMEQKHPAEFIHIYSGRKDYSASQGAAKQIADLVTSLQTSGMRSSRIRQAVQTMPIGDRRIPLISHVQAGNWSEAADPHAMGDGFDFLLTDQDLSDSAFALEIKGDSMLPEFKPGDRVIIDPAVHPQPGDFVVAKNGEEEATFKKYRPRGVNEHGAEVFELVPLNEDYATMRSDVQPIRIVGTMVEHRKYRRR